MTQGLNKMKAFFKTLVNLAYPDPKEPEPVWQLSDNVALVHPCAGIGGGDRFLALITD